MTDDPAKKQYLIFSAILALIISFILNFFFFGLLQGPIISGFPFNVTEATGVTAFFSRLVNTIVLGGFLTIPIYYFLQWLQNRGGY